MIINIIQDVATPHNNTLIKALVKKGIQVNLWYAFDKHPQYSWNQDLSNEIVGANIYGHDRVNWNLIQYFLRHKSEKIFIVGWVNPTVRLLIILLWVLRRPFNIWFDYPQDKKQRNIALKFIRRFYFFVLRMSRSKIFCVGKMTVEYFGRRGFEENRLFNLPVYIDVDKTKEDYNEKKTQIRERYGIENDTYFLVAGSRLIYEKGFDLLITGISFLPDDIKRKTKVLIVGKGEEKNNLANLIKEYHLEKNIVMEDWMEIDDFKACLANSDLFIHPARFDAFGGTIVAMSVGTPVIGSTQSGAAFDRIEDGVNGFLYDAYDVKKLSALIGKLFLDREKLLVLSKNARKTAEAFSPESGAENFIKEMI